MSTRPAFAFASPRKLPNPSSLDGRVVVLDIAFASEGIGRGFEKTTGKFIQALGPRLAAWIDHHDHPRHSEFEADERFVLCTKAQHGACPEMITPELVARVGPIDTIVAHFDLDGIYAAAKWALGGHEPYVGADDDARAVDTRIGTPSAEATRIDHALRAHYRDPVLKIRIIDYLLSGLADEGARERIEVAKRDYDTMAEASRRLAEQYSVEHDIATVRVPSSGPPIDKTELLLLGQKRATVSIVIDAGNVSIAASFESGLDFVELLDLGGGMPTRVNIPEKRLDAARTLIRAQLDSRTPPPSQGG